MTYLSVVIPTYNEGENITPLLRALKTHLADVDTEFLVVDDDSSDGTVAKAHREGARTIVRTRERGLGTAVVRGIAEANGKYVVVMDADFQHPPKVVARLLQRAQETDVDMVVGSRYARLGGEEGFSAPRRMVSIGASLIAKALLPSVRRNRLTDPMSGLFLVRRDRIHLSDLHPKGYKILLELLERSPIRHVEEVGYVFSKRLGGESKLGAMVMFQFLLHVTILAWSAPRSPSSPLPESAPGEHWTQPSSRSSHDVQR